MIWLFILIIILLVSLLGYLLYALHQRVEKISQNQAVMVQWCDTLRQNEEQILNDFKRLQHEVLDAKKEVRRPSQ